VPGVEGQRSGIFFLLLGIVVQGDKIDRFHQKRHETAVHRHLADNLAGEGKQHQRAVDRENAGMVFLGDILEQKHGGMLEFNNEHHRIFVVFVEDLGGDGNGYFPVIPVNLAVFQLQVEINLGVLVFCQKTLGALGLSKEKSLIYIFCIRKTGCSVCFAVCSVMFLPSGLSQ
jgi:hypothetical protein